jgi:predicted NACHT family NTPase
MIEHRNIGHNWQFSKQQKELLQQYYYANLLLVDCLNNNSDVIPAVRSHIEETLLLPIAEIEKHR